MLLCLGTLDGLNSRVFGRWLLTDGDQSVIASQAITNLETHNVAMAPGATLNSHNISHLLTDAVLLSENTTFDKVVFGGPVSTSEVQIGGRMSHLQVPADIVMTDSAADQLITGHKTVHGSVSLAGDLLTIGLVSDVNVTAFCLALLSNQSKLIISGSGKFHQEPEVLTSVDGFDWPDIMDNVWFKDDNVTDLQEVSMDEVEIRNLTVVDINNNNVEEQLSRLVSLSADQVINGTFYFPSVRAEKGLKADKATVGGNIEGIQLPAFTENVLLNGIDQKIGGYLDFNKLVIKHNLNNSMFVNGLNMTSDLMLANVESNTMSAELTLDQLITRQLRLPAGAPLAGVDVLSWSRSAITKSGIKHVISGDITVTGQLDSGHGVRVKGLVNGLPFDDKNLMTLNGAQETKGKKRFSSETRLTIHNLTVEGSFNNLNFTAFCDEQVTARGDVRMSGPKQFTAPVVSQRVVLPQIYHGHNLTWLEYQLSAPLPWSSYQRQLDSIMQSQQLASQCLAGKAYYLKNLTRARDVDGDVLFTLPLRSGNTTVLGVVRKDTTSTSEPQFTLSLLHWSDKQNTFTQTPGGVNYLLRTAPSQVQMVTLPGGDLAAYVTSYLPYNLTSPVRHGDLLRLKEGKLTAMSIYGGQPGSNIYPLLDYKHRTCFIVISDGCKVHCYREGRPPVRLPKFHCRNITKATTFRTDRGQYVLGVQTQPQGSLFLWRMSGLRFTLV
ncbi:uncharacterized protein LOC128984233 [Macrosteles quadrilineatus]|uniref:uncharacterized protein LOC128984233 n=1 Tax=Macrosteles quadrilineatus TaxID=74068 RepID=UPI0023E0AD57|nr:uncharacterized protein LOC128984233 [Macrosteles quadrilineatus]